MASMNRVFVMGNLGGDPELRKTANNTAVVSMNVATKEFRPEKDGTRQEYTEWHRIVVWGRQAENCAKYLTKGRPVFVEGRLQTRSWEDKSGVKRYTTEIVANNVQFLGTGANREQSQYSGARADMGGSSAGDMNMNEVDIGNINLGGPDTPGLDDIPF
jgi:single-strand DNA-binding protein